MSLKFALLGLLADGPQYGYEIKRSFEAVVGNLWSVSYGQLYPTLRRLLGDGLVRRRTTRGKRAADRNVYSLTAKGARSLEKWLMNAEPRAYSVKDEFTLKFLFFHRLPRERVLEHLRAQREQVLRDRESFQRTAAAMGAEAGYYPRAIVNKGIVHLAAEEEWLSAIIAEMERAEGQDQEDTAAVTNHRVFTGAEETPDPPPGATNLPPADESPAAPSV